MYGIAFENTWKSENITLFGLNLQDCGSCVNIAFYFLGFGVAIVYTSKEI